MLELKDTAKVVGGETHIHPTNLVLERGSLNVLLGPTLSGKTCRSLAPSGKGGRIHAGPCPVGDGSEFRFGFNLGDV